MVEEITTNVNNLIAAVEAQAIIRPGFTERQLAELQMTADILEGAAGEIQSEPIEGYHPENGDREMVEEGGVENGDGNAVNGKE